MSFRVVSWNHPEPDIATRLRGIAAQIARPMPATELVRIRDLFDDASFLPELTLLLARLDNQPEKTALINCLTLIMRWAETFRDRRESARNLIGQMAVGGGTGLMIGGVVAMLNPVIGFPALIVVGGGALMGGLGWFGARRLDERRSAYKQIAERLSAILKAIEP